jgi:hypothetical protein
MVAAMKRSSAAILPILLAMVGSPLACRDPGSQSPGDTPPPPASTGAVTGTGSSGADETATTPIACGCPSEDQSTDECPCPEGQACAADHALGDPAPEAYTCRPDCIPDGEPLLWCFHLSNAPDQTLGCCTGTCRPDGLCGSPIEPTTGLSDDSTTGTGSTTDSDSTTDPTTGLSDDSTTGTGSTTDSDSTTDPSSTSSSSDSTTASTTGESSSTTAG